MFRICRLSIPPYSTGCRVRSYCNTTLEDLAKAYPSAQNYLLRAPNEIGGNQNYQRHPKIRLMAPVSSITSKVYAFLSLRNSSGAHISPVKYQFTQITIVTRSVPPRTAIISIARITRTTRNTTLKLDLYSDALRSYQQTQANFYLLSWYI